MCPRRYFSAECNSRVKLAAVSGPKTNAAVGREHRLTPSLLSQGKAELVVQAASGLAGIARSQQGEQRRQTTVSRSFALLSLRHRHCSNQRLHGLIGDFRGTDRIPCAFPNRADNTYGRCLDDPPGMGANRLRAKRRLAWTAKIAKLSCPHEKSWLPCSWWQAQQSPRGELSSLFRASNPVRGTCSTLLSPA